jgi:predicted esterase
MMSRSTARILRAPLLVPLAAISLLAALPLTTSAPHAQAQQPVAAPSAAAPAVSAPAATAEPAIERAPLWIQPEDNKQAPILAYPPSRPGRAPLMVMLHGMCDAPQNECPSFVVPSTSGAFLVCPRANLQCDGGGTIWSGEPRVRSALLDSALQRVRASFPGRIDETAGATLVGFSLGSFVALDVAQRSHGEWTNLVLIGAKIEPDARLLQRAGVKNVLLASGDRDMMKWHMVGEASKLRRRGVRATYLSMGNVGHWFAHDMDAWLAGAQQWLDGNDDG